jgi:hypothetical protein
MVYAGCSARCGIWVGTRASGATSMLLFETHSTCAWLPGEVGCRRSQVLPAWQEGCTLAAHCACVQVCADSVAEARRDADALSARHATLRRRLRQLYGGYRALRYRLQDDWPAGAGSAPPRVAHEDAVLGGTLEDIIR